MEVHGTSWLWHANDWAITGGEGQSRTDTGLLPPVFESGEIGLILCWQARLRPFAAILSHRHSSLNVT